jgi:hypothetical protein
MTTRCLHDPATYAARLELLAQRAEREPRDADVRFQYAMALLGHDRKHEAFAELCQATEIRPDDPDAIEWHDRVARAIALDDRIEQIRDDANAGVQVNPQDWADCSDSLGLQEGIDLLEEYFRDHAQKVADDHPLVTTPLRTLAWSLAQTLEPNNLRRACELASHASSRSQRCVDDLTVHALVAEAAGEIEEARRISEEGLRVLQSMTVEPAPGNVPIDTYHMVFQGVCERADRK